MIEKRYFTAGKDIKKGDLVYFHLAKVYPLTTKVVKNKEPKK